MFPLMTTSYKTCQCKNKGSAFGYTTNGFSKFIGKVKWINSNRILIQKIGIFVLENQWIGFQQFFFINVICILKKITKSTVWFYVKNLDVDKII